MKFSQLRNYAHSLRHPGVDLDKVIARKQNKSEAAIEADLAGALERAASDRAFTPKERLSLLMDMAWAHPPTRDQIKSLKDRHVWVFTRTEMPGVYGHYCPAPRRVETARRKTLLTEFSTLSHELCHANQPDLDPLKFPLKRSEEFVIMRFREAQATLVGLRASEWVFTKAQEILGDRMPASIETEAGFHMIPLRCEYFDAKLIVSPVYKPYLLVRTARPESVFRAIFEGEKLNSYDRQYALRPAKIADYPDARQQELYSFDKQFAPDRLVPYTALPGEAPLLTAEDIRAEPDLFYGPWNRFTSCGGVKKWLEQEKLRDSERDTDTALKALSAQVNDLLAKSGGQPLRPAPDSAPLKPAP